MRNALAPRDRVLVVGVTGSGKTTYTIDLVTSHDRVIVWDIHDEYSEPCGLDRVTLSELRAKPDMLLYTELRLAVVPTWMDTDQLAEELRLFVGLIKSAADETRGADEELLQTLLVVEETAAHRPQADGVLAMLAMQARHWEMPAVFVSQRIIGIPPGARSQATRIVSFLQTDPDDLKELSRKFCERTDKIAHLQVGKSLCWQQSDDFARGKKDGHP